MNNKEDFKAFLTDDRILNGFLSGIYLIYANMYLSTRGNDHWEAERFFNSDFFKHQFGDQADAIVEELKRKRRNHERLCVNRPYNKSYIKEIDDCQGCAECIGCGRKYRKHKVIVCDLCGKEVEEVHIVYGDHICNDCLPDMFEKIREEDLNE